MPSISVVPYLGRDYRTKKDVIADLKAGKDFLIQDMSCRWDGKPANLESFKDGGYDTVYIRYANLHKQAVVKVADCS